jgi:hypothetical protein
MFNLRSLFYESPFILSVVGEHFCSEGSFTGAPRRNVGILFGHRRYATTKQDNGVQDREWFRGKYAKTESAARWLFVLRGMHIIVAVLRCMQIPRF